MLLQGDEVELHPSITTRKKQRKRPICDLFPSGIYPDDTDLLTSSSSKCSPTEETYGASALSVPSTPPLLTLDTSSSFSSAEEDISSSTSPLSLFHVVSSKGCKSVEDIHHSSKDWKILSKLWKIFLPSIAFMELCAFWPNLFPNCSSPQQCAALFEEISVSWRYLVNTFFVTALVVQSLFTARRRVVEIASRCIAMYQDNTYGRSWINTIEIWSFLLVLCLQVSLLPLLEQTYSISTDKELMNNFVSVEEKVRSFSLMEITIMKFIHWFHLAVYPSLEGIFNTLRFRIFKKLGSCALRTLKNPKVFRFRLTQALTAIRWTRFLAPLFCTCNKLRCHMKDLMMKRKQRLRSRKARTSWRKLLQTMTSEEKLETAALRIQTNFRSRREIIALNTIMLMKDKKETKTIVKVQARMRARAALARVRIARARRVLTTVKSRRVPRKLSIKDRAAIAHLKKDIVRNYCRNRGFLLHPNTTFSVLWKIVTVTCVILEVLQITLAPHFSGELGKMPLDLLAESILLPASENRKVDRKPPFHQLRRALLSLFKKKKGTEIGSISQRKYQMLFMYIWSGAVQAFIQKFVYVVKAVCFLDVFITFFTGEINAKTGVTGPKSFFKRWILPGLAFQILVNPSMKGVLKILTQIIQTAQAMGITHFLHILLSLFPALRYITDCVLVLFYRFLLRSKIDW